MLFDGARDQSDTTLLATNGGATGVAIKLYEDDQKTRRSASAKCPKITRFVAGATCRHRLC
ncbi:fimbrial protein [Klebsiella variicola]|uniref:Fimbrial protein n=1 Tax=Klebsiella variicola TaxID=244366 RepID=A0A7H4MQT4_KLEVA|nr:fimbrial protein [Klebsiella variicola]